MRIELAIRVVGAGNEPIVEAVRSELVIYEEGEDPFVEAGKLLADGLNDVTRSAENQMAAWLPTAPAAD
jgi:hypothetical protein